MDGHFFHLEPVQFILDLLGKSRRQAVASSGFAPAVVFRRVKGMIDGTFGCPVQPLAGHRTCHRPRWTPSLSCQAQHRGRRVERDVRVEPRPLGTLRLVVTSFKGIEAGRKGIHGFVWSWPVDVFLIGNVSERTRLGRLSRDAGRVCSGSIPRSIGCSQV